MTNTTNTNPIRTRTIDAAEIIFRATGRTFPAWESDPTLERMTQALRDRLNDVEQTVPAMAAQSFSDGGTEELAETIEEVRLDLLTAEEWCDALLTVARVSDAPMPTFDAFSRGLDKIRHARGVVVDLANFVADHR